MGTRRLSYAVIATLLGNTLEWFEYLAFAFFAPMFAEVFFPLSEHSIINSLVVFSIAYIMRPFGGVLFGYIGDRFGRKNALIASILFMSFPTFFIGIMPTYAQIGFLSILLLAFMRGLQGIGTGGEFPASITFLVEMAPPHSRSLFGSFAYLGLFLGVFLGGTDYFLLTQFFPHSTSSWRAAYLFGAILGILAFILRTKLHETHPFQTLKESHEVLKDPIFTLFQKHKKGILKVVGIQTLQSVVFNILISFSVIYFSEILKVEAKKADLLNWAFLFTLVIGTPLAGLLGNKIGAKKLMRISAWGFLILAIPLYLMIQESNFRIAALIGLGLLSSLYMGPSISVLCEAFPAKVRLSGVAMGYNLNVAIFGGTAPLISYYLIQKTNLTIAPAFLIMAAAVLSLFSLHFFRHPDIKTND